jgi:uncharacterized protein DUF1353
MRRIAFAGLVVALLAAGGVAGWNYHPDFIRAFFTKLDPLAYKKGKFKGELEVRFFNGTSGDGQPVALVLLLKPFGYTDSSGVDWDVPEGFISDGASIPTWLWAVLGGPFDGPYRDAAVIHDYYCYKKSRPWEAVHKVFLEASLNRGTGEDLAKTLYAGVLLGGPRWDLPRVDIFANGIMRAQIVPIQSDKKAPSSGKTDKEAFDELKAWIEREKPSLDEIRKRVEEIRKAQKK